ncbi:NUDIX hydrolase [Calothrix sp. PCC 6303]|uniref:NUDIX hydrolase n=1 Tax=Calothrix sp. PCC 6303 TaxID=1170562 RepID=UPI0002A01D5A|nr:NUDIX hydrolase [Calothrix sp. PCC 6303]AFZ03664.1 NUDIX hydrolase [Calothrix sp. PCC 6303]
MNKLKKWTTLKSEMVLNHNWCKVRQDEIQLPNGTIIDDFFVHIKPDVALVLAITENQEIIFVQQYRHAIDDFFIELPAGTFNPEQESSEEAALRELEEETGYIVQDIQKIATLYDRPSKDTNKTHLFFAKNAVQLGTRKLDVTEEIKIILIPVDQVLDKINQGEISVMGTVTALLMALNFAIYSSF